MSFIGLDIGTSFIKGAVLNLDSLQLEHIRRVPFPEPLAGSPPLFYEVDPLQVVSAARAFLEEMVFLAPDCQGVVLCTQMHGLVLATKTGRPRSNAITWQDQRALLPHPAGGGTYFDRLSAQLTAEEKGQLGHELKPSLPLCYLVYLKEVGQLPDAELIPASLADFVLANLSQATPTIDLTNAASHGAINLETLSWHRGVIEKLGLAHLNWPQIRAPGEVAYHLTINGKSLPVYPPIGDHQCAILGACLEGDELSLNVATASQVTALAPGLRPGAYQTRPFFEGRFLNTIARIPAGRSLNVLVDLLCELPRANKQPIPDPWDYIVEAAAATEQTTLQVDLSFFASSVGDRGSIANIGEDNLTVGHLFRAAFQNMAGNYLACARRLIPQGDTEPHQVWRRLVFSGGLAQKIEPLRALICRTFKLDSRLSASAEDTLLGLLALALVITGRAESTEAATTLVGERMKQD